MQFALHCKLLLCSYFPKQWLTTVFVLCPLPVGMAVSNWGQIGHLRGSVVSENSRVRKEFWFGRMWGEAAWQSDWRPSKLSREEHWPTHSHVDTHTHTQSYQVCCLIAATTQECVTGCGPMGAVVWKKYPYTSTVWHLPGFLIWSNNIHSHIKGGRFIKNQGKIWQQSPGGFCIVSKGQRTSCFW